MSKPNPLQLRAIRRLTDYSLDRGYNAAQDIGNYLRGVRLRENNFNQIIEEGKKYLDEIFGQVH